MCHFLGYAGAYLITHSSKSPSNTSRQKMMMNIIMDMFGGSSHTKNDLKEDVSTVVPQYDYNLLSFKSSVFYELFCEHYETGMIAVISANGGDNMRISRFRRQAKSFNYNISMGVLFGGENCMIKEYNTYMGTFFACVDNLFLEKSVGEQQIQVLDYVLNKGKNSFSMSDNDLLMLRTESYVEPNGVDSFDMNEEDLLILGELPNRVDSFYMNDEDPSMIGG